ncbi:MAG: hypothetical protein ABR585_13770 [Gemmatimonadaceae bacterium]
MSLILASVPRTEAVAESEEVDDDELATVESATAEALLSFLEHPNAAAAAMSNIGVGSPRIISAPVAGEVVRAAIDPRA